MVAAPRKKSTRARKSRPDPGQASGEAMRPGDIKTRDYFRARLSELEAEVPSQRLAPEDTDLALPQTDRPYELLREAADLMRERALLTGDATDAALALQAATLFELEIRRERGAKLPDLRHLVKADEEVRTTLDRVRPVGLMHASATTRGRAMEELCLVAALWQAALLPLSPEQTGEPADADWLSMVLHAAVVLVSYVDFYGLQEKDPDSSLLAEKIAAKPSASPDVMASWALQACGVGRTDADNWAKKSAVVVNSERLRRIRSAKK